MAKKETAVEIKSKKKKKEKDVERWEQRRRGKVINRKKGRVRNGQKEGRKSQDNGRILHPFLPNDVFPWSQRIRKKQVKLFKMYIYNNTRNEKNSLREGRTSARSLSLPASVFGKVRLFDTISFAREVEQKVPTRSLIRRHSNISSVFCAAYDSDIYIYIY